jgi:aminoglycoside phosphotransferase (APT) family kinase protein
MRASGAVGGDTQVVGLHQLEGGWSRHSYVLSIRDPARGERELIVRVRPPGALLETELRQEFDTYVLLADEAIPTPAVHGFEADEGSPFGGPFFVMDRLPGTSPNVWRDRDRVALERDWEGDRRIAGDLVEYLAGIHSVDVGDLGGTIEVRDFHATIDHWQGIHERMQLVRDPVIEEAYAWARGREPEPVPPRLVHGDYRIGNSVAARRARHQRR